MGFIWTPTYTAIIAAVISSSILIIALEPFLNWIRKKRLFKGFQAIQLSTGQFYFGKVASITKDDIKLRSVFYLSEVKQDKFNMLPGYSDELLGPDVYIVKLGQEVHGPADEMIVGRSHIVFIENLRSSSRLIRAINNLIDAKLSKLKVSETDFSG